MEDKRDFEQVDFGWFSSLAGLVAAVWVVLSAFVVADGGWSIIPGLLFGAVNLAVVVLVVLEKAGQLYGRPREEPLAPELADALDDIRDALHEAIETVLRWLNDRLTR